MLLPGFPFFLSFGCDLSGLIVEFRGLSLSLCFSEYSVVFVVPFFFLVFFVAICCLYIKLSFPLPFSFYLTSSFLASVYIICIVSSCIDMLFRVAMRTLCA